MIQAKHDSNNNANELEALLVMSTYIVKLPTQKFISDHMDRFWMHVKKSLVTSLYIDLIQNNTKSC